MNPCVRCGSTDEVVTDQKFCNGKIHRRITCKACSAFKGFAKSLQRSYRDRLRDLVIRLAVSNPIEYEALRNDAAELLKESNG